MFEKFSFHTARCNAVRALDKICDKCLGRLLPATRIHNGMTTASLNRNKAPTFVIEKPRAAARSSENIEITTTVGQLRLRPDINPLALKNKRAKTTGTSINAARRSPPVD